jgi:COMPASS component SWD3
MEGHTEGVWCITYSHDAKYFMSASPDKMVLLWDLKAKKPIKKMKEHTEKVFWASFNEDSKIIASVSED